MEKVTLTVFKQRMREMCAKIRFLPHHATLTPPHRTGYFEDVKLPIVEMRSRCNFMSSPVAAIRHHGNGSAQKPASNIQGANAHITVFNALDVGVGNGNCVNQHTDALRMICAIFQAERSRDVT
jgi:hypothetical protein